MDVMQTVALTMGTSWASGINLYAALLVLGYLHQSGSIVFSHQDIVMIYHAHIRKTC